MQYSNNIFFYFKRFLILVELTLFSVIVSRSLLASLIPFVFKIFNDDFNYTGNDNHISLLGWLIIVIFFGLLFYNDGKKDTSYGEYSLSKTVLGCVSILTIYTLPAQLLRIFVGEDFKSASKVLTFLFNPSAWLQNSEITLADATIISSILIVAISVICYFLGSKARMYKKRNKNTKRLTNNTR